jgi:hypothetical protein
MMTEEYKEGLMKVYGDSYAGLEPSKGEAMLLSAVLAAQWDRDHVGHITPKVEAMQLQAMEQINAER